MERDYDEVISDILIQLAAIEQNRERENERVESLTKRMNLTVKRVVKVELRLEELEKQVSAIYKTQKRFIDEQAGLNRDFLDFMKRNP